MMAHEDLSAALVFKLVANISKMGTWALIDTMKIVIKPKVDVGEGHDGLEGLVATVARVKAMSTQPTMEGSSVTLRMVVLDNSQRIIQLVGRKGRVFVI
jgi:hypothetical protein